MGAESQLVYAPTVSHTLTSEGHDASEDGTGRGVPLVVDGVQITHPENRANPQPGDPSPSLAATSRPVVWEDNVGPHPTVRSAGQWGTDVPRPIIEPQGVRRLMPVEVERLFGLPDHWTAISDGKPLADSPRYRMLGNGAGVPVLEWIGRRLAAAIEAGRKSRAA